ncbi:MAG TPA: hypothetical protein VM347_03855 [Nonomuraea sp.]|nr:hypothetical protein [Nonomuraea sp.]
MLSQVETTGEPLVLVHHQRDGDARRAELAGQGDGLVESGRVVARVEILSEKTRVMPATLSARFSRASIRHQQFRERIHSH